MCYSGEVHSVLVFCYSLLLFELGCDCYSRLQLQCTVAEHCSDKGLL